MGADAGSDLFNCEETTLLGGVSRMERTRRRTLAACGPLEDIRALAEMSPASSHPQLTTRLGERPGGANGWRLACLGGLEIT